MSLCCVTYIALSERDRNRQSAENAGESAMAHSNLGGPDGSFQGVPLGPRAYAGVLQGIPAFCDGLLALL